MLVRFIVNLHIETDHPAICENHNFLINTMYFIIKDFKKKTNGSFFLGIEQGKNMGVFF